MQGRIQTNIVWLLLLFLLILCGLVWQYNKMHHHDGALLVVVLDVGQGTGIYIKSPQGVEWLVDTGPTVQTLRQLGRYRPWYDRHIDGVVVSHGDSDHMTMLPRILHSYQVGQLIVNNLESDNALHKASLGSLKHTVVKQVFAGDRIVLDDEVYINVLAPFDDSTQGNRNNRSIVLQLVHGDIRILMPGDIERSVEKDLVLRYSAALASDVLVVAHHGSKTSTSRVFVQAVNPQLAIIPVGRDNRYGHPHPNTRQTLGDLSVPVVRTDVHGDIILVSDGKTILLE